MAEIKREILDGADRTIRTIGMTVYETTYKNKKRLSKKPKKQNPV